jgi:hypothetical protein
MNEVNNPDWYNVDCPSATWDATEIPIETHNEIAWLCPFVAMLPGPDARAVYSIDIANGPDSIRSLASGFADTLDAARAMALEAIDRIATGLEAV